MKNKISEYIKAEGLLQPKDQVIVGLSGGADSTCLFLLLYELKEVFDIKLAALHLNHMIRKETAARDEEFCRRLCDRFDVPFYSESEDVVYLARSKGLGEEEAGRIARRRLYGKYSKRLFEGRAKIALAHHRDDVAEGVLLSLARGTGLKGMSGILPISRLCEELPDTRIIRPLLAVSKEEIVSFLEDRNEPWCEDETNEDISYMRNSVRKEVIPALLEINSRAREHIANLALDVRIANDYIAAQAEECFEQIKTDDGIEMPGYTLDSDKLSALHPALGTEVIKIFLQRSGVPLKDIGRIHYDGILQLTKKAVNKRQELPRGFEAVKGYGTIYITKKGLGCDKETGAQDEIVIKKLGQDEMRIVHFGGYRLSFYVRTPNIADIKNENSFIIFVNYDRIDEMCLRFSKEGDDMAIDRNGSRKKLSRIFIDQKVPQAKRRRVLVLAVGGDIIWAVGIRQSVASFVAEGAKSVLCVEAVSEEG